MATLSSRGIAVLFISRGRLLATARCPDHRHRRHHLRCGSERGDGAMLREELMPAGIGKSIAVPHARMRGLTEAHSAVSLATTGIDGDSPDGCPAHVILLVLTPGQDDGIQLKRLANIAKSFFCGEEIRNKIAGIESSTEFLALTRSASL